MRRVPQLGRHPNFVLPDPQEDEDEFSYTLRCAATLISPPKLPGEDESTPCEVVAQAVYNLLGEIRAKWREQP